ncbi:hypothetical protein [Pannonibacter indicus]|uniref:hypothetical protein n=1 Tax=Pannonibacter indicus TaxID=466044 RepID=UPI00391A9DD0
MWTASNLTAEIAPLAAGLVLALLAIRFAHVRRCSHTRTVAILTAASLAAILTLLAFRA